MENITSNANSREEWDRIWAEEGEDTWRTYPVMYSRIVQLVPSGAAVLDLGCGVGKLLDRLKTEKNCTTYGIDISPVACKAARNRGHDVSPMEVRVQDIRNLRIGPMDYIIGTEFLEHLPPNTLHTLLNCLGKSQKKCIFAVPNNCLGPDVESQHHHQWTAIEFKRMLERYFDHVRVECLDDGVPRLLAVCNVPKHFKLAFTMPVKNEAADIERVLKSFRGAADYIVIGVDDKSSDDTEKIAREYADVVFQFEWEKDFSKARNLCIERCRPLLREEDWIFMSEGHEHLEAGLDELLNLDQVLNSIHVVEVRREDRDHAWMFPWLFRNHTSIYFENPVHNALVYDDKRVAQMPAVRTWHARSHQNAIERAIQRRSMNRQQLIKQLTQNPKDARACYYLANEWRQEDVNKAISFYQRYLEMNDRCGPQRYQARLQLAQCLFKRVGVRQDEIRILTAAGQQTWSLDKAQQEDMQAIYDTLIAAPADDWSRNEHWLGLGDLCATQPDLFERALRFYELAAVSIGREPLTFMWIEKANYTWLPAQKLVTIYALAGMLKEALHWCNRVAELLPEWASDDARNEVEAHRRTIIEKMKEAA